MLTIARGFLCTKALMLCGTAMSKLHIAVLAMYIQCCDGVCMLCTAVMSVMLKAYLHAVCFNMLYLLMVMYTAVTGLQQVHTA
jgi:hypothetical protein